MSTHNTAQSFSLVKWLSVGLQTKCLWAQTLFQSIKFQI